jgi:hypothetical protein
MSLTALAVIWLLVQIPLAIAAGKFMKWRCGERGNRADIAVDGDRYLHKRKYTSSSF